MKAALCAALFGVSASLTQGSVLTTGYLSRRCWLFLLLVQKSLIILALRRKVCVPVRMWVLESDSVYVCAEPPKCTAIEVCEYPQKEPCGHDYCEYPSVCATLKKEECYGFLALKEKCGKPKKVCKEIMKPCGYGACGAHQDCVKETVCKIKKVGYGRKLMEYGGDKSVAVANSKALALGDGVAVADATAVAKGGYAIANSEAIAVGGGYYDDDGKYYPHYYDKCDKKCEKEKLVCEEKFTCVAKGKRLSFCLVSLTDKAFCG